MDYIFMGAFASNINTSLTMPGPKEKNIYFEAQEKIVSPKNDVIKLEERGGG